MDPVLRRAILVGRRERDWPTKPPCSRETRWTQTAIKSLLHEVAHPREISQLLVAFGILSRFIPSVNGAFVSVSLDNDA